MDDKTLTQLRNRLKYYPWLYKIYLDDSTIIAEVDKTFFEKDIFNGIILYYNIPHKIIFK